MAGARHFSEPGAPPLWESFGCAVATVPIHLPGLAAYRNEAEALCATFTPFFALTQVASLCRFLLEGGSEGGDGKVGARQVIIALAAIWFTDPATATPTLSPHNRKAFGAGPRLPAANARLCRRRRR